MPSRQNNSPYFSIALVIIVVGIIVYSINKDYNNKLNIEKLKFENTKKLDSLNLQLDLKTIESEKLKEKISQLSKEYKNVKSSLVSIKSLKSNESKIDTVIRDMDDYNKREFISKHLSNN